MNPNIGISDKNRAAVVKLLQGLLADEHVIYLKTRNAHWNVTGPHFNHLHKFFEEQYDQVEGFIDELAERIKQLGGHAPGTFKEYLAATRLKEHPGREFSAQEHVEQLLKDHETLIRQLRGDAESAGGKHADAGTEDFLVGLMESHEKMAWMLRASLKA